MKNQKAEVVIHTLSTCPYCNNAKKFLKENNIEYKEVTIEKNPEIINQVKKEYDWPTLPLILVNGQLIGGYDDMLKLRKDHKLMPKLQSIIAGLGDSDASS